MPDDYAGITLPSGSGVPHTVDHPATSFNVTDNETTLNVGDLRRGYNFGNMYTLLSYKRDPFLHFANTLQGRKRYTDDPKWKYTTKRKTSAYKRYGYVVGIDADNTVSADVAYSAASPAAWTTFLTSGASGAFKISASNALADVSLGQSFSVLMASDYKTAGNIVNPIGRTSAHSDFINLGDLGTRPNWFLPQQVIKIPTASTKGGTTVADYVLAKINSVFNWTYTNSTTGAVAKHGVVLNLTLVKVPFTSTNEYPVGCGDTTLFSVEHTTGTSSLAQHLEPARTYIVGTVYHELSGYGETWRPQPYSTEIGMNQIFKVTAMMSNRARATSLKFGGNPWQEEWEDKFLEMNWNMGQTMYFGDQWEDTATGETYTEGAINYTLNNGNQFTLTTSTKTIDDFLEDWSAFNDPRYMYSELGNIVYFCRSDVWNWLHMVGGFFQNNLQMSPNMNFMFNRRGLLNGVQYSQFSVLGGNFNIIRDVHLDGTHVKMVGLSLDDAFVRPLFANGYNRDMTVYPAVKSIENSGEDYRVDLIQADVGYQFGANEKMSVWL